MRHVLDYIKSHKLLSLVVILGFFFHLFIIVPSGTYLCFGKSCGIQFWGVHNHDTVWHIALANVAFQKIPFISPVFSGAQLTGYNFLLDLLVFLISKLGISLLFIYFKLLPVLWFFLTTYVIVKLGYKLHKSSLFVAILLFFVYFGGSFAFLFTIYHKGSLQGASGMLAMQSILTLTNLQYAFSLICIGALLYLSNFQKSSLRRNCIIGLIIFVSFGLKFYSGIIGLFYIGVNALFAELKHRKTLVKHLATQVSFFLIIATAVITSIIVFYNPFSSLKTGFPLIFSPFSIVHSMIEDPSLFYLKDMTNARYFLYSKGFGPKLLEIELFSTFLFIFFNLGSRFFGVVYVIIKAIKRKLTSFDIATLCTMLFAFLLSIFFIQKGEWWNSIQFSYFGLFLGNFFIAELIYILLQKKNTFLFLLTFFLLLSNIPENVDVVNGFNMLKPSTFLPQYELDALTFLKKQSFGVVYVPLYEDLQKRAAQNKLSPPYPLYSVVDSAYVAAFSQKPLYLADLHVLRIMGVSYTDRYRRMKNKDCSILEEVNYVYSLNAYPDQLLKGCQELIQKDFRSIFDNRQVTIYSRQNK